MTKQVQTRVLAYTMAKEITEEDMKEVSGGTVHPTLLPSCAGGSWPSSMDTFLDLDQSW